MSSNNDVDDFEQELDLLERYEQMIEIQIETINSIDDKAAYTGRLIAVLGGLILTAVSIAVSTDVIGFSETTLGVFVMLGIGTIALFISLVFAIFTYLSSRFVYGPSPQFGTSLAKEQYDPQEYRNALLRGYSYGVAANKRVVRANANRFKRGLTALLLALLHFLGAGVLLILPDDLRLDVIVFVVFTGVAVGLALYIIREEYLTIEDLVSDNE